MGRNEYAILRVIMEAGEIELARPPIVAICGPTATGKTATSIIVAKELDGEIISADSMAVYRGMEVGTAKPGREERNTVPFHLLDIANPDEQFNVSRFKRLAEVSLEEIWDRGKTPFVVGGTGLYLRALLEDFSLTETPPDEELRTALGSTTDEIGAPAMHARLAELDPIAAARIHPNDRIRILRATEVCIRTGEAISAQHDKNSKTRKKRAAHKFVLTTPREELYRRIDARVEQMIASGLEGEVRNLLERGYGRELSSMRSLGYKEMSAFIAGECDLAEAVGEIKRNTRRFAKRQLTWFRAEKDIKWIDIGQRMPAEVAAEILDHLR